MKKLPRYIRIVALLVCIVAVSLNLPSGSTSAAGEVVGVWVTTPDQSKLLQRQADLTFAADSGSNPVTIDVNEATTYQVIDGFGASLTDSSASLICGELTAAQRDTLLNNLFNPNTGIGLSFLRQPMGASDFSAIGNYSYDDMPAGQTDPNLNNFNINRDLQCIIPLLKQIKTINPALKIMANPWSPPGWMKTSNSMIGGSLRSEFRTAWANYFVKFVQAYTAQGLPIDYISMQNEPLYVPPGYPGMGMSASEQATLLANYLGPAFAQAGISSKILVWDHNWTNQYPYDVLGNATARSYAAGTAFHWYGGSVTSQTDLHNAYPDKGIWFSEGSGFTNTSFAQYLKDVDQLLIIANMRNWGKATVRWNLVLDQDYGPKNGGCANCTATVTINNSTGAITYNAEYYALAHASKFVVPGAYRIASNNFSGGIENVAFRNPDGSKVVIAFNAGTSSTTFKIRWSGQAITYTLPAGAVATFKWISGGTPPPTTPPPTTPPPTTPPPGSNLALGRPVVCSSVENAGMACANAVDGNTGTRWASLFSDPQWIYVDLGASYNINRVVLNWEAAYGRSYQIQVSANASSWTTIYSTTTGNGGVDDLAVSGSGRYVRMNGTARATGYGYSLWEYQIFGGGTPPPTTPPPTTPPPTTPPPTTPPPGQAPYGGTAWAIPGTVQAENYDTGGEGVAYHDTTTGNSGTVYRTDGVDIQATTDTGAGYNIGWTAAGEWLEYTINVATSGTYSLNVRAAAPAAGGSVHMEIDGVNVTGAVAIPSTGGWQTWSTVTRTGLSLSAGQHVMRITLDAAGFNLNWVSLTSGGTPPPTTPPPTTPPPTTNLALNRPVTCSSTESGSFSCPLAVDGNPSTRWASAFSDPQWISVDLGSTRAISRVVLRWEAAYGRSYQIQVSNDGTNWTSIYTTTTGDGGVDDLTGLSGSGRYVRMLGTLRATQYGYSLFEFEIYGS